MSTPAIAPSVDRDVQFEVERFLAMEAWLLDERDYARWLDVFAEDVRYWAPLRTNRARRELHLERSADGDLAYFDDDKEFLRARVRRLETGMAWAEDPPSRTRHLVSNVLVDVDESGVGDYRVRSSFLVYRNRLEHEVDLFAGSRDDIVRREGGELRIARRTILLDQNVILAKNVSIFF